jgi:DNA-binding winged helix-turn-helix (wHTH) protein
VLIFDPINYLVSSKTGSVQLQPLSFKLLEKLAETPGEIQSVDSLMAAVWGDIKVSADTLKQRVFVLRKPWQSQSCPIFRSRRCAMKDIGC